MMAHGGLAAKNSLMHPLATYGVDFMSSLRLSRQESVWTEEYAVHLWSEKY